MNEQLKELNLKIKKLIAKLQKTDYQSCRDNAIITLAIIENKDITEIQNIVERFVKNEAQRQKWRDEINSLETQIEILKNQ